MNVKRSILTGFLLICAAQSFGDSEPVFFSQIELGRALFEDKNLSLDRSVACASCHVEARAFTDARPVSVGIQDRHGTRNAPSLLYLALYTAYFWDGRVETLDEQLLFPLTSATEMGLAHSEDVVARIRENAHYLEAFKALDGVAPNAILVTDVARAIKTYELSLSTAPSTVDSYLRGSASAVTPEVRQGLDLFRGKAKCADCHRILAHAAPLTDNDYHSSGVGMHSIAPKLETLAQRLTRLPTSERYQEAQADADVAALGRFLVTLDPKDIGKFRTPSLRNVSRTAPYMHDGSVETLGQAVDIELYYRGLDLGYPIILSNIEERALLAFLRALSTPETMSANAVPVRSD
jgi:cytochrome c peroxidase